MFGQLLIRQRQAADLFEAFEEEIVNLPVPPGKFSEDFVQKRPDSVFRECHYSRNNPGDPLRIAGTEGPQKYARLVGLQDRAGAVNVD